MSRKTEKITVYDVVTAATDAGEWVNGEFEAVVRNATARQGNKPSKADLCDRDNPNIKVKAAWFGGDFTDLLGALCLFGGQGMKIKSYKGAPELSLSDKSTVNMIAAAPPGEGKPMLSSAAAASAAARPHAPANTPEEKLNKFHRTMKRIALLYLHADQYVMEIENKRGKLSPEQRQAAVSSMFITGKDQGLLEIVPAPREKDAAGVPLPFVPVKASADPDEEKRKADEAAEKARKAHEEEQRRWQENLDEDVPF